MNEIIHEIAVPAVTAVLGWFFARKRSRQEIRALKLDNEIKTAKYYQGLLDDTFARLRTALEALNKCEDKYRELMAKYRELITQNELLIGENKKINRRIGDLLKKIKNCTGEQKD
jgi:Mg2+ and Co2+ transporter CorA